SIAYKTAAGEPPKSSRLHEVPVLIKSSAVRLHGSAETAEAPLHAADTLIVLKNLQHRSPGIIQVKFIDVADIRLRLARCGIQAHIALALHHARSLEEIVGVRVQPPIIVLHFPRGIMAAKEQQHLGHAVWQSGMPERRQKAMAAGDKIPHGNLKTLHAVNRPPCRSLFRIVLFHLLHHCPGIGRIDPIDSQIPDWRTRRSAQPRPQVFQIWLHIPIAVHIHNSRNRSHLRNVNLVIPEIELAFTRWISTAQYLECDTLSRKDLAHPTLSLLLSESQALGYTKRLMILGVCSLWLPPQSADAALTAQNRARALRSGIH